MTQNTHRTKFSSIKTESAFSKGFAEVLRYRGHFVQRIESGLTGRGIPDIYAIICGHPYWIELKRIKTNIKERNTIPWRPGQERWLRQVTKRGQNALTIACFDDKLLVIKHDKDYFDKTVGDSPSFSIVTDLVEFLEQ